jgi:hypothetical protein
MMPLVLVLVFALFQLIGGGVFGAGLRQLYAAFRAADAETRSANLVQARGSLAFGAVFGGAGTLMSALSILPANRPFFLAGVALLALAVLGSLFLPRFIVQELGAGTLAGIGIGLIVVPMGVLVAIEGFRNGDVWFGLAWGGCAGFVGLVFVLSSLQALLSGKALVLHETAPGTYEMVTAEQAAAEGEKDTQANDAEHVENQ